MHPDAVEVWRKEMAVTMTAADDDVLAVVGHRRYDSTPYSGRKQRLERS